MITKKVLKFLLGLSLIVPSFTFTSCSDEDEPKVEDVETTPTGMEMSFDDALYFEQNFVTKTPDGNNVLTSAAKILDEGNPLTLYVGAESAEDAKEKFMSWLCPTSKERVTENSDGNILYLPMSYDGNPQGSIQYQVNDDGYQFGRVTLSSDVPITTFKEIIIIRYLGFPENSFNSGIMSIESNRIGAKVTFTTNYFPKGSVGFVTRVKDSNKGIPGEVTFVFKDKFSSDTDIMGSCPTLSQLETMAINFDYLKRVHNFDIYAEYKKIGVEFSSKTVFWSSNWTWKGWWLFKHVCYWSCDLGGNRKIGGIPKKHLLTKKEP